MSEVFLEVLRNFTTKYFSYVKTTSKSVEAAKKNFFNHQMRLLTVLEIKTLNLVS